MKQVFAAGFSGLDERNVLLCLLFTLMQCNFKHITITSYNIMLQATRKMKHKYHRNVIYKNINQRPTRIGVILEIFVKKIQSQ